MKKHELTSALMTESHRSVYPDPCVIQDGKKIDIVYIKHGQIVAKSMTCDAKQARRLAFMLCEAADQMEGK